MNTPAPCGTRPEDCTRSAPILRPTGAEFTRSRTSAQSLGGLENKLIRARKFLREIGVAALEGADTSDCRVTLDALRVLASNPSVAADLLRSMERRRQP